MCNTNFNKETLWLFMVSGSEIEKNSYPLQALQKIADNYNISNKYFNALLLATFCLKALHNSYNGNLNPH